MDAVVQVMFIVSFVLWCTTSFALGDAESCDHVIKMQIDEQNQEWWTFIVFTILALFSLFLASAVTVEGSDGIPHTVTRIPNVGTISMSMKENPQLCQLCEEFASEALFYLNENETQTEIIDTLHQACSKFRSFKLECTRLVDYYAPLFFTKIASLSPEEFCASASFCGEVTFIRLPRHEDTCTLCHEAIDEIVTNLEDPDIELKIIEILLKGCNNAENFVQKCKRLIIQNAPIIMEHIKKFLEKRDFCNSIHVCGGKSVRAGSQVLRILSSA